MVGDPLVNMILKNKQQCTTKNYTPRILSAYSHLWINFVEQRISIFGENKQYEKEYYNREITIQEVKKATKNLKNNKSTGPEFIKNEFIK